MAEIRVFCKFCGKRIVLEAEEEAELRFCPFCGKDQSIDSELAQAETEQPEDIELLAADFYDQERGILCYTGYVPDGFRTAAKLRQTMRSADSPVTVWAFADNGTDTEWFFRSAQVYYQPKQLGNHLSANENQPFLTLENYLDAKAASILSTEQFRRLRTFPASEKEEAQLRQMLSHTRLQMQTASQNSTARFIVQGQYGAAGGKLYQAERNGKSVYLLLYGAIIATESGIYHPAMQQNLRSMQTIMARHSPYGASAVPQQQFSPDISPDTPFGKHRRDGLTEAGISWQVIGLGGMVRETEPDAADIKAFLYFCRTLQMDDRVQHQIEQIKQKLAQQIAAQALTVQNAQFAAGQAMVREQSSLQFDPLVRRTDGMLRSGDSRGMDVFIDRIREPEQRIPGTPGTDILFGFTELERLI